MRIEVITDTYLPDVNGVAMTLGRLVKGLRQRGHLVHLIHTGELTDHQCTGETRLPAFRLPGYQEVRVGLPNRIKLQTKWKKKRPDAIYVATESPLGASAIKAALVLGIPILSGFHTNFHQYMEDYRLSSLRPATMKYLRKLHNKTDTTLVPCEDVREMLTAEGFERVEILGRGVDTELFDPAKRCQQLRDTWGATEHAPVVAIIGRVAAEKNIELGLKAFQAIRQHYPDAQCIVVGDGPVRDKLAALHPHVIFTGIQQGEDLARHYASADLLLFPSESETFGNVLLEGMASGLITVTYDYAAAKTHVQHPHNGFKAPKGNSEEYLTQAIAAAKQFQNQTVRTAARKSALEHSWAAIVDVFEAHLARLAREVPRQCCKPKKRSDFYKVATLILSDIHLGTPDSKVREVVNVLKNVRCKKLILNGDIIDGWALKRGTSWSKSHTRFIRTVLKKMEKEGTEVIYLRGNHDDILDRFLPFRLDRLRVAKEHIHQTRQGKRYLVIHGDGFDSVSTNHKWLAHLGAIGYDWLLRVNRLYNRYRNWKGKDYYSVSKSIKARVKGAVSFIDRYEEELQKLAKLRNCQGIICGHIHTPSDKQVGDIHYLNSGDWVESLTGIIEHTDGTMELLDYPEFLKRFEPLHQARHPQNTSPKIIPLNPHTKTQSTLSYNYSAQ